MQALFKNGKGGEISLTAFAFWLAKLHRLTAINLS